MGFRRVLMRKVPMVFLTTLISVALYHGFVQAQTHKVSITCRAAGDRQAGVGNDHLGPLDQGESGVRPPRCAGDPARQPVHRRKSRGDY
jgi:hypothetical protein